MAAQRVARADVGHHAGGDLARVGALAVRTDVLGAELQGRTLEVLDQVAQVGHRRQDHQLDAGDRGLRRDLGDQRGREVPRAIQFPVARDDPATHARSRKYVTARKDTVRYGKARPDNAGQDALSVALTSA